jgi:hypothetical protein
LRSESEASPHFSIGTIAKDPFARGFTAIRVDVDAASLIASGDGAGSAFPGTTRLK